MLACTTTPPSFCPIDAIGTRTASATGGAASEKVLVPDSPAPDPRLSSYALNECPPSPTALDLFAPHPQTPSSGAPTHLSLQTVSQENGAKDAPRVLVADSPQPLPPQKDHSTTGLLEPKLNPTKKKSSFMSKFINANPEVSANKSGHQPTNRQGFPIRLSSGRPCTELNQNNLKAKPTSNKSTLMKALGLKQQSKAKLDSSYLARMKEAGDLKIAIAGRSLEGDADVSRRKNTDTGSSDRQSKSLGIGRAADVNERQTHFFTSTRSQTKATPSEYAGRLSERDGMSKRDERTYTQLGNRRQFATSDFHPIEISSSTVIHGQSQDSNASFSPEKDPSSLSLSRLKKAKSDFAVRASTAFQQTSHTHNITSAATLKRDASYLAEKEIQKRASKRGGGKVSALTSLSDSSTGQQDGSSRLKRKKKHVYDGDESPPVLGKRSASGPLTKALEGARPPLPTNQGKLKLQRVGSWLGDLDSSDDGDLASEACTVNLVSAVCEKGTKMPGKNEFDWDDCDLQHDSKILIFQVSPQKPTSVSEVKEPLTIAQASTPASAPLNSETFQSVNRGKAPSDRNEPAQPVFESDHETEEGMIKWCGLDVKRGDAVFARVGKKPIYSPCKVQNYDPKTCMYQLLAPPNNPQPSPLPRTAFFCRSDPEFVSCKLDPRAVAAYTDTSGSAYNNMRTLPSSVAQHMPAVLQAMHGIVTGARPSAFMDALRRGDVGALQNLVYMSRTADVLADDIEEAAFEREVRDGVMMSSDWANGFCRDENGIEAALRRDRLVCWVLVPEGLKILKGLLPGRGVAGDTRKSPDQWVKRLLILRETLSLGRKMQSDMSL